MVAQCGREEDGPCHWAVGIGSSGVSRGRVFTSLWMVYTRLPFIALVLRVLPYLPPSHLSRGPFLLVPLCDRNHGLYHQQR